MQRIPSLENQNFQNNNGESSGSKQRKTNHTINSNQKRIKNKKTKKQKIPPPKDDISLNLINYYILPISNFVTS